MTCTCFWLIYNFSIMSWSPLSPQIEMDFSPQPIHTEGNLSFTNSERVPLVVRPITQHTLDQVTETLQPAQKNKKYEFESNWYLSYKITIKDGKISAIKFEKDGKKYKLYLNKYDITSRSIKETYGNEYIVASISGLQLWEIQRKVKNWYGGLKKSINYFTHAGLQFRTCQNFVVWLLKKYHNLDAKR